MKDIRIASLIITHSRVEEAKAQMDIIRELWQPLLGVIDIYHEFNGKKSWYPQIYREDHFCKHKSMQHFSGACHLFNQGIKHILESGKDYDYIIAASADTWIYDPKKIKEIIQSCKKHKYELATSLWGGMVLATEFFVITPELAGKVFPLKLQTIVNSSDEKVVNMITSFTKLSLFESLFTIQVMKNLKNHNRIYLIPGRKVVLLNRHNSPGFYASHHSLSERKRDVNPNLTKLLAKKKINTPALNKLLGI